MSDVAAVNVSFRYNKTGKPSKTYGGKWWYNGMVETKSVSDNGVKFIDVTINTNGYIRKGEHIVSIVDGKKFGVTDNNQEIYISMTETFAINFAKAILAKIEDKTDNVFTFNDKEGVVYE